MDKTRIPALSSELVEWLSKMFPDRCPGVEMSDRQVWIAAGAAGLVRKVKYEFNRQHNQLE